MADDFKIELDPDLDEKVAELPALKTKAKDAAKDIAAMARSLAPRESGAYAAGIVVQTTKRGARVFASDPKSAFIEFGVPGRNQPARWVLRTAAARLGYLSGGTRDLVKYVSKAGRVSHITRAQYANYTRNRG